MSVLQNLLTEQEIRQLATKRREQGRAQTMGFLEVQPLLCALATAAQDLQRLWPAAARALACC